MRFKAMILAAMLIFCGSGAAAEPPNSASSKVIVLGVEHSAQLVSKSYRPAVLEAYFSRVKPDAICIERDPVSFAAGDHYEFTYEISEIAVPYAARNGLHVCPFDWAPSASDIKLSFGSNLMEPPVIRQESAFVTFDDAALKRTLFWAENRTELAKWDHFADNVQAKSGAEMSRRLFLYRTALQARRIAAAARSIPGRTILVVVGAFHERDIETMLSQEKGIELIQAPEIGAPSEAEIAKHESQRHDLAALTFNLLGRQSGGPVDWRWMNELMLAAERRKLSAPEIQFLRLRLDRLTGAKDPTSILRDYNRFLETVPREAIFTWTGAKDVARLDTFFDPFGNLTVRQRLMIEIGRELYGLGRRKAAEEMRAKLASELTATKRAQLEVYWNNYLAGAPPKSA